MNPSQKCFIAVLLHIIPLIIGCATQYTPLGSGILYEGTFRSGVSAEYWDKAYGDWYTSREHGLMVGRGGVALVWFRKPLDDFTLECDAQAIKGGGLSIVVCGLGKGARFDTGYQIAFGERENQQTFLKRLDTIVQENNKELLEHDKTYRIKVRKYGATIQFFLDGRLIFDYTDPDPLTGQFHQYLGLGGDHAQWTMIAYDNVRIYRE